VQAVEAGRKRGLSYGQIADLLGVSPSAAWHALHRGAKAKAVPAGERRTLYIGEERWALLTGWADQAGVSYSAMAGLLVDREQAWREQNQPLPLEGEPVIPLVEVPG
jgi:orotate phosphoribosyltransferase-like protein